MGKQGLMDADLLRGIATVSLDKLRLMQRPKLTTTVSAAAAAEFERRRLREEEGDGKGRE